MGMDERWITTAIGAFIGTTIVTLFTWNWLLFPFTYLFSILFTRFISWFLFDRKSDKHTKKEDLLKPFVVSEYYARMEKAQLEILESQEPVSQVIILWWGLDGIRLNEDGTIEWIRRKKKKPVQVGALWQPYPTYYPPYLGTPSFAMRSMYQGWSAQYSPQMAFRTGQMQNTALDQEQMCADQIENLHTRIQMLQMQAAQQAKNQLLIDKLKIVSEPKK